MAPIDTLHRTSAAAPVVLRALCTVSGGLTGGLFLGFALALWVWPGSSVAAEVLTMKAGLSAFLVMAGTTLISAARGA